MSYQKKYLCIFAAFITALVMLCIPALCAATDYQVTNLNDSGAGSLRQAISDLNSGGSPTSNSITFTAGGTINLLSPLTAMADPIAKPVTFINNSGSDITFSLNDTLWLVNQPASFYGGNKINMGVSGPGQTALMRASYGTGGMRLGTVSGNFNETSSGQYGYGIFAYGPLSIDTLSGNVSVNAPSRARTVSNYPDYEFGFSNPGILTIGTLSGTVSATVTGDQAYTIWGRQSTTIGVLSGSVIANAATKAYAINADSSNTAIYIGTMSGTISATAGLYYAGGFDITGGSLTIDTLSGSIIAKANTNGAAWGIGLNNGPVTIGTLSGIISASIGTYDVYGIKSLGALGAITIPNLSGTVSAHAGTYNAYGLYSTGPITLGDVSGKVSAIADTSYNAFGIITQKTLNGGAADVPAVISGNIEARAAGLAVGVASKEAMNLRISGTVSGTDTSSNPDNLGYAIRSGYLNGANWAYTTANNVVTLDTGASLIGKVDLGNGASTLNLVGSGSTANSFSAGTSGTINMSVGNGTDYSDWAINPGFSGKFAGTAITPNATLAVNAATFESPVTVTAGGTLTGTGTIKGAVNNYGTVAPGNSLGTLTIDGNYVQQSGSTLAIETNAAGQSDLLYIKTGNATINSGTTLYITHDPTRIYLANTDYKYKFIHAEGGISGTFSTIVTDNRFFNGSVTTTGNDFNLTLRRNPFSYIASTDNESALGGAIEKYYSTGEMPVTIANALFDLPDVSLIRNAYSQMAGLVHTATPAVTFLIMNQYLDIQKNRMAGFVSGGPLSMLAAKPVMLTARTNTGSDANNTLLAAAVSQAQGTQSSSSTETPAWGLWMQGYGSLGQRSSSAIASKYDYNTAGLVIGFDRKINPSLLLGATFGYSYSKLDMKDLNEDARINTYNASLYGIYKEGPWYLSGIAAYGYNKYDTTRDIAFGTISRSASTSYNGDIVSGYVEGGYKVVTEFVDIIPMASFQASYLNRKGFSEDDAVDIGLSADAKSYSSYLASLGVRFKKDYTFAQGKMTPEFRFRYDHEFSNDDYVVNASFLGSPVSAFSVSGDKPDQDRMAVGLGVNWLVADNASFNLSYDGYFSGDTTQHAGMLGFKYTW